jgi:membrane fusion protein (multidrug efflux system)
MKNKIISSIGFALCLAGFSSCGGPKETPKQESTKAMRKTILLERNELSQGIRLPGELKAFQEVDIYAKVNSYVREVLVDRGSKVKRDQELILLDAPELDAQYNEAKGKLRSREAMLGSSTSYYQRLLTTSRTPGTVSANDLEQAQSKMLSDSSEVSAARSAFQAVSDLKAYLIVRAPFDGMISERNVHPGATAGPSGKGSDLPMLRLDQEGMLRLVVAVPEIHTGSLSADQQVKFQVKAFPNDTFQARIKRVSGRLDLRTRSELVEMDVENKDGRLLPGMYAEVELGMKRSAPAFVVPSTAVFTNSEGVFLIRKVKGVAEWVPVIKGNQSSGKVEVFGSLNNKDEILEQASDQIRNGDTL